MQVIMWGSHLCPECVQAQKLYARYHISVDYRDITKSLADLKEFLALRESYEIFRPTIASGKIGIPCVVLPDGTITQEPQDALAFLRF